VTDGNGRAAIDLARDEEHSECVTEIERSVIEREVESFQFHSR
jgi:hypothetical protein